jgi:3-(3-hydroxy-phenyl)propionate hydroxylase
MPERRERHLAAIDVKPGAAMESQSGLQMLRPRIYGAYETPSSVGGTGARRRTGAIVMHPTSNFMGHYLIGPLADRGITCLGLNSRYAGNDTVLLMERVLQDLGAGVKFMRDELGCERVVLVGNSGGAALAAYYQAEAEHFSAETMVDGDPTHIVAADLPPVDGLALCAAHEGRSHLLLRWIDPSLVDEHDGMSVDPALDMYDPAHWADGAAAPPRFDAAFLARFMAAQRARRDRIEARVRERLAALRATSGRAARRSVHRLPHARRSALPRPRPRRQRSPPGQRLGRRTRRQLQRQRDGPDDVADRVPVAVVVGVARRRTGEPGADVGAGAAPHLHRRPEHVPEHARCMAARRRRPHQERRHRRRRSLPRRPSRSADAGRRRDRRLRRGAITTAMGAAEVWKFAPAYELPSWPFVAPPDLGARERRRYPVVIAGAGLAGLTLACDLALRGIAVVVLDEDDTVGVRGASSRGICYAQKSLELFDRLGIYERIREKGITWSVGRTFSGADEIYSFNLKDESFSEQPPFINLQQFYLEWFLVERIRELDAEAIRWKSKVVRVEHGSDGAVVEVETPAGAYALEAEWFIDATGANSRIRDELGLEAHPSRHTDRWCISDVRFKTPFAVERWTWIDAPFNEGRAVWQHLMADAVWRLDYQMDERADPESISRPRSPARACASSSARRRVRVRLDRPVPVPRPPARHLPRRPDDLHRRRRPRRLPVRRARRQQRHPGRRQPRLEARPRPAGTGRRGARRQLPPRAPRGGGREPARDEPDGALPRAAQRRRASPAPAVVALARTHEFARRLANTGRMAQANAYPPSPWAPDGARSLQNVALDGTTVMRLLGDGTRFLGLWLGASREQAAALNDELAAALAAGRARGRRRRRAGAPPRRCARQLRPRSSRRLRRRAARVGGAGRDRGGAAARPLARGHRMKTEPNIADPDGFYEAWVAAHDGLSDAESADLDARLVLLLANQVGEMKVLLDCIAAAARARLERAGDERLAAGTSGASSSRATAPSSFLHRRCALGRDSDLTAAIVPRRGERSCGQQRMKAWLDAVRARFARRGERTTTATSKRTRAATRPRRRPRGRLRPAPIGAAAHDRRDRRAVGGRPSCCTRPCRASAAARSAFASTTSPAPSASGTRAASSSCPACSACACSRCATRAGARRR